MNVSRSIGTVGLVWRTSWFLPAAVALLLESGILIDHGRDPTFYSPVVDAGRNHREAVQMASHQPLPASPFWQPPLYPLTLAAVYSLTGKSIMAAKVFQAIIGAVTCALIALIGARLFGRTVGRIGGLILAASGPFLFYNLQFLATGLSLMLDILAIQVTLMALERPTPARWALGGCVSGLAGIAFPNFLVFAGALALWILYIYGLRDGRWRTALTRASIYVASLALVIAPVTIRNYVVSGEFVPISYNGGCNLFLGNNPNATATTSARPGFQWDRLMTSPALAGVHGAAACDHWFRVKAWEFIRSSPSSFFKGLVAKADLFLSAREIPRNEDPYEYRDYSRVLRILVWRWGPIGFPFGLVLPLAVLGILVGGTATAPRRFLLTFAILNSLAVITFFVSSRHRLPVAAVLGIFAAYGVVWLVAMVREGRRSRAMAGTAAVLLVGLFVNRSVPAPTDRVNFRAETKAFLAAEALMAGRYHAAEGLYRQAIAIDSSVAETYTRLAALHGMLGRQDLAMVEYRRAIDLDPDEAEAHLNLGALLGNRGDIAGAIASFRSAVAAWPAYAQAHYALGDALALSSDDRWIEEYRTAWRLEHGPVRPAPDPGEILLDRGLGAAAVKYFRKRYEETPSDPDTKLKLSHSLSRLALTHGPETGTEALSEALNLARSVVLADSTRGDAHRALANALTGLGRYDEAVQEFDEAIRLDPRSARVHLDRARLLIAMRDERKAEEELAKAIDLDPLMIEAYQRLSAILSARGDRAGATEVIRRATLARGSSSVASN